MKKILFFACLSLMSALAFADDCDKFKGLTVQCGNSLLFSLDNNLAMYLDKYTPDVMVCNNGVLQGSLIETGRPELSLKFEILSQIIFDENSMSITVREDAGYGQSVTYGTCYGRR